MDNIVTAPVAPWNTPEMLASPVAADGTGEKQRGRPFQPGQSGNPAGRPKGARNRIGEMLLNALADDFAEHGSDAIASLRQGDPATYFKLLTSVIPKHFIVESQGEPDYSEMSDDEIGTLLDKEHRNQSVRELIAFHRKGSGV